MTSEPLIARKVGEGVGALNAEQELPIDINYMKIIDFLVSRQKLPSDWHKRVQAISRKAVEAIKETPGPVLSSLSGGADAPVDYFRAVQIRDKLAATCERTLFGGLTGAAAVWDKVVKAYENKCVFLGEAAQTMERNVNYEIPDLRKQGAALNQQVADLERRHTECVRSAAQAATGFQQECRALGIDGSAVRPSLRALSEQLPQHFEQVLELVQADGLAEACSYYRGFSSYAHATPSSADMLPTLSEVREGRTSAPSELAAPAGDAAASQQGEAGAGAATLEVDWGEDLLGAGNGGMEVAAPSGGVNWDLDLEPAADMTGGDGSGAAEISWDIDLTAAAAGGEGEAGTAPADIDWDVAAEPLAGGAGTEGDGDDGAAAAAVEVNWDIDLADAGAGDGPALDIDWDVSGVEVEAEPGPNEGAAASGGAHGGEAGVPGAQAAAAAGPRGAALLRLERDVDYRSQLLDDLQELRAFLVQRRMEMRSSGSELLSALLPEAVQAVDAAAVGRLLTAVDAALGALTGPMLRQLLLIKTSKKYFERLAGSLERRAGQEARLLAAAKEAEARKQEARKRLAALAPRAAELVSRTRAIKAEAERALSAVFAGRKVHVLGEINTVCANPGL